MERSRYDRGSKWMIKHHGDLILYLGKIRVVEEWRDAQPEVMQPRQIPDGMLEARRRVEKKFIPSSSRLKRTRYARLRITCSTTSCSCFKIDVNCRE